MDSSGSVTTSTTYGELCVEPQLLDDARIFTGSEAAIVLGFGTSYHHLAARKDQSRRLGLANTHDDGGETLGIVLGVASVKSNRLEVQASREVDRGYNVLKGGHDPRGHLTIGIGGSRRSGNTVCVDSVLLRILL